jgi:anaerobic magnesium-protoporphyrin IX monomethyl ester cyclase
MYESGCRYILWGIESGCQRILDLIDKGTSAADNEEILKAAHEVGIRNHVFIISGFPTETRAEFQVTLDFLARHKADIASVHRGPFQLEKDSLVFDHPERFAISRSWLRPGGGVYDFECASGMTQQQARQALGENMLFLRSFANSAPQQGDFRFRDHALLLYSRQDAARR